VRVSLIELDLGDLGSVAACACAFENTYGRFDLLINNGGVRAALACRLMPLLEKTTASRLVVVSSAGANFGQIDFSDLNFERRAYRKWIAYGQSKLAHISRRNSGHPKLRSNQAFRRRSAGRHVSRCDISRTSGYGPAGGCSIVVYTDDGP
jgi:hypothetical protein